MAPAPAYWLRWANTEVARVVRDGADVLVQPAAAQAAALHDTPGDPDYRPSLAC